MDTNVFTVGLFMRFKIIPAKFGPQHRDHET